MRRPLLWILGVWILGVIAASYTGFLPVHLTDPERMVESKGSITVTLRGTVEELDITSSGYSYLLSDTFLPLEGREYGPALVSVLTDDISELRIGNTVCVTGRLSLFGVPDNPGQFDSRSWHRARGLYYSLKEKERLVTDPGIRWLPQKLWELRSCFRRRIRDSLPGEDAGLFLAVFLGESSELDREARDRYQLGGIVHILAISGLHISLFGMTLYRFLKLLGSPAWLNLPLCSGFLGAYVAMTGGSASAVRACIMFGIFLLAVALGRTYDMLSAMSVAAILLLWEHPLMLWQSSFQLSFLAVVGVAGVWPVWEKTRILPRSIGFSLAIQLTTLPAVAWHYYVIPVYSCLVNQLILPFTGILVASTALTGVTVLLPGSWGLGLARLLILPARGIQLWYDLVCEGVAHLPGHSLVTGRPEPWQIICYILLFLAGNLYIGRKKELSEEENSLKKRRSLKTVWIILLAALLCRMPDGTLQVTALDVGQGDCIFLRTPEGRTCLIDGGSSTVKEPGTDRILPFLEYQGVRHLNALVVSHGDEDHINGLAAVLQDRRITTDLVLMSRASLEDPEVRGLRDIAAARGIPVRCLGQGDSWKWGETEFRCLYPSSGAVDNWERNKNNSSLVLQVESGEFRGLFTGDLPEEGERELLREGVLTEVTLLKVGHHGSRYSSSSPFLKVCDPEICFLSCGARNHYGHPHQEVLERLNQVTDPGHIYLTRDSGALTYRMRRGEAAVEVMKPGSP